MDAVTKITDLDKRTRRELDDWSNYFFHSKTVWRAIQQLIANDHKIGIVNAATGQAVTGADFESLSPYYFAEFINPSALQRYCAIFEGFVFNLIRILLEQNPGKLRQGKRITLGDILRHKNNCDSIVAEAIEEELNALRYARPSEWFAYAERVQKSGCPTRNRL